jgi:hypothetical protein
MALEAAQQGKDLSETEFACARSVTDRVRHKPIRACPVCGTKPDKFILG